KPAKQLTWILTFRTRTASSPGPISAWEDLAKPCRRRDKRCMLPRTKRSICETWEGLMPMQACDARQSRFWGQIRELSKRRFVEAMPLAIIHIGLGDNDEALKLLEKAEKEHDHDIAYLKIFHVFDPLRPDPRFQALLHRLNFPQ